MDVTRDSVVFASLLLLLLLASSVVVAPSKHDSASSAAHHVRSSSRVTGSEHHKWYDIYYDAITSKKIPMVQRFGDRQDEPSTARFGRIPCSCQDLTCGCCAQFNVRLFSYNKRGCMNFTYDPFEFAVKGNVFMDEESRYEYKISAKNPPPACMQVPVPYVPSMDVCVKMFDIYTPGRTLHACVNFVTRIEHAEVLVLEFDCFVIGRHGVTVEKYNNASTAAAPAAEVAAAAPMEDYTTTTTEAVDNAAPDLDLTVVVGATNDTASEPDTMDLSVVEMDDATEK